MTKFVVFYNAGICGTEMNSGVQEFENEAEAVDAYWNAVVEWALNWADKDESWDETAERVECWAEEYDPEKHDGQL